VRCHVFLVSSSRREVLVSLNVKNALDFYAIQGLFFFEKSKFASEYKEKTGNTYKLPSGYQKNSWDIDDIVPFLKTQPLLDILEKQKINDRSQLRLFAPQNETQEKVNQTIDVLTERPMTQKDENWAYAGVYNNKNYKKGN